MQNDFGFTSFSLVFSKVCNKLTTTKVAFSLGFSKVCNKLATIKGGISHFCKLSPNGHFIFEHLDFGWILLVGLFTGVNPYPIQIISNCQILLILMSVSLRS